MRQHILTTALAAAVSALAFGQNLNPTVEVTNAYEGGASSISKPAQQMAVPDSVTRFNLDFDYSVFEKPFRGSYEFRPYYVQLKPEPKANTEEKFYLRTGAGLTFHPELDFVWSPVRKEKFRLNLYANHHSYFGRYHQFGLGEQVDGVYSIVPKDKMGGYLADTKAGVDAAFGWDSGVATVDVNYLHRMADNVYHYQKMGGVEAKARVRSLPSAEPHFLYDAAVDYHFLDGDFSHTFLTENVFAADLSESAFAFDGTFGPVLDENNRILVDVNMDLARYRGDYAGYTGLLSVTPKYQFNWDRWRFSLGGKMAWIIYSEDFNLWEDRSKSGTFFPDVHIDYYLLDDQLILQTAATGGDKFNTFSGRFFERPFSYEGDYGHSTERVRAMIGVRGNIASRFRYDLQGGYARWTHARMDGFKCLFNMSETPGASSYLDPAFCFHPMLVEKAFNLLFVELDYGWKSESVTVDGLVAYRHTNISGDYAFAPAAWTGFIRPAYNWGDRVKAGFDVAWSTRRKATYTNGVGDVLENYFVPGWVDLGLFAEYRFTHRFGFWAKGGNLLNQAVQRTPLVAEAGMYFTAGILLNF
ncbi:MAG: hypothetical protein IKV62_03720 [Bacteroidales bacterium]|nr:hypothetical protein [Bacteroidales bacterium]